MSPPPTRYRPEWESSDPLIKKHLVRDHFLRASLARYSSKLGSRFVLGRRKYVLIVTFRPVCSERRFAVTWRLDCRMSGSQPSAASANKLMASSLLRAQRAHLMDSWRSNRPSIIASSESNPSESGRTPGGSRHWLRRSHPGCANVCSWGDPGTPPPRGFRNPHRTRVWPALTPAQEEPHASRPRRPWR